MLHIIGLALLLLSFACVARGYAILPREKHASKTNNAPKKGPTDTCSVAVFLGSGGHTSEMMILLSGLDFARYTPRTYVISEGDQLSAHKAFALEASKAINTTTDSDTHNDAQHLPYTILTIPRARRVHQSLLTTPPTALRALLATLYHLAYRPFLGNRPFADVLILNGPGTCFVLCIAALVGKFFGIPIPKLIYVESFARVKSLSLSGKLLRPLVDRFVVQWLDLLGDGGRGEYRGWLV